MEKFLNSIKEGAVSPIPYNEIIAVTKATFAVIDSINKQEYIKLQGFDFTQPDNLTAQPVSHAERSRSNDGNTKFMNLLTTYILKCSDNSYYVGVTNNIERRFKEYQEGINVGSYTHSRLPVVLKWGSEPMAPNQAIALEKQIKGWTRKKKEALINNNWDKLKEYAKCLNESSHVNYKPASTTLSRTDPTNVIKLRR